MRKQYRLENLNCAHCAAQIEAKLNELEGLEAKVSFATKGLSLTGERVYLLEEIQAICRSIEAEVLVVEGQTQVKAHTQKKAKSWELLAGVFVFVLTLAGWCPENFQLAGYIVAYLLLGGQIILTAIRGLGQGRVFDENFLMTLATVGAFIIGEYPEAVGVMLFYRVGEYLEGRAVERSRQQIMAAVDLRPVTVNRLTAQGTETIAAAKAVPGDVLVVRVGENIPLDGVVVAGTSWLNLAAITGESVPVRAKVGQEVLSGSVNMTGVLQLRVQKDLAASMVSTILQAVETAAANKPQVERFITKFARIYTPVVVALALAIACWQYWVTGTWTQGLYTAATFLVISCPCALVLSVPLTFFAGIGEASRQGMLFKGGAVVEALRQVQTVVLDKTGTLTKGDFQVQQVAVVAGREAEFWSLVAGIESFSNHPIALSVLAAARERGVKPAVVTAVEEVAGAGLRGTGATGIVLCGSRQLLLNHAVAGVPLAAADGTEVLVAVDGEYLGQVLITDSVKPEAREAVATLRGMGLAVVMLTGDNAASAQSVAQAVGITDVRSKLLPQDKLRVVTELQAGGERVLFVGDGINDAPVLAGSQVGAAMGSGADAALAIADVVFMTSHLSALAAAIKLAQRITHLAWQNIILALSVKLVVLVLGALGWVSLWLAVFADSGVALLCVLNALRLLQSGKPGAGVNLDSQTRS
ncbi:MAG: heavy metal translocating P-type ATPase [Acidaminococcaceae bacterium]